MPPHLATPLCQLLTYIKIVYSIRSQVKQIIPSIHHLLHKTVGRKSLNIDDF